MLKGLVKPRTDAAQLRRLCEQAMWELCSGRNEASLTSLCPAAILEDPESETMFTITVDKLRDSCTDGPFFGEFRQFLDRVNKVSRFVQLLK
jgi:hypothetical protein